MDDRYHGYKPGQLRTLIESGNWPHAKLNEALAWLDQQEEADQAHAAKAAKEANRRERTAAIAAIVAAVTAIVTFLITVLAWLFPRGG